MKADNEMLLCAHDKMGMERLGTFINDAVIAFRLRPKHENRRLTKTVFDAGEFGRWSNTLHARLGIMIGELGCCHKFH